ncbi:DoxX family protein [Segniliparus rotundus DSM 44985]|uniref:DoxX family protein n=1 Tax=Segniliparus rotundus (strain ATCC BAA-972 / CDC 1076 / CIP 108378 / DSM 44985 / JCM 13578) TaxID=640132 RepID=D6Z8A0_SEGRD|nr:DoxX family protein [Segniliparus rotundus]ADG98180.1 DoxX family protein [Segniliparus rotundus DSM 44985]
MSANSALAYAIVRIALGLDFFCHGFFRLLTLGAFHERVVEGFAKAHSPLPHALVSPYAFAISFFEAAIGALLLIGLATKPALIATALLILSFMFGSGSEQKWTAVSTQLLYAVIIAGLVAFLAQNHYSVDRLLARNGDRGPAAKGTER